MYENRVEGICVKVSPKIPVLSVTGAQENSEEISCEYALSVCSVSSSCPSSVLPSLPARSDDPGETSNTDPNEPYGKSLLAGFFTYNGYKNMLKVHVFVIDVGKK